MAAHCAGGHGRSKDEDQDLDNEAETGKLKSNKMNDGCDGNHKLKDYIEIHYSFFFF